MKINIFEDAKERAMPQWAKFTNAGDSAQGTYVGKIVGAIDGYGNEQIIYQLLQEDGTLQNVGFGLNKKVLNQEMSTVKFGQVVGFRFKGKIQVKDKFGKPVEVKDFAVHQDSKIVDEKWLSDNKDNMPIIMQAEVSESAVKDKEFENYGKPASAGEDIPFSSPGSLTNEDKMAVIEKLAKEKLGVTDPSQTKEVVMTTTGIAYIPVNFQKIIDALTAM